MAAKLLDFSIYDLAVVLLLLLLLLDRKIHTDHRGLPNISLQMASALGRWSWQSCRGMAVAVWGGAGFGSCQS